MNKIIFLSIIVLILTYCCSSNFDDKNLKKIKFLEFSRVTDTLEFIKQFDLENEETLIYIIESMGKIQDSCFVPFLINKLQSNRITVRNKCIFALGQIGTSECENILIDLYGNEKYFDSSHDIVAAIGKCGKEKSAVHLINNLESMSDSLKAITIQNLAYIYSRIDADTLIRSTISKYLQHESLNVRESSIYFLKRNPYPGLLPEVFELDVPANTLINKYKLSALLKIFQKQTPDSLTIEKLKTYLFNDKNKSQIDWMEDLYGVRLLSFIGDSVSIIQLSDDLNDHNPHLRLAAIAALGKIKSPEAKDVLLKYYDQASWAEKGNIILALADHNSGFIYRLIQQNLDQGTIYFKELLLKSLAKIGDNLSRQQLHQFLNVPSPRLQAVAFQCLTDLYDLTYTDVRPLLISGDLVLTFFAANWILENPEYANLLDLINAYQQFSEPQDVETMAVLIDAVVQLKSNRAISFLDSIYLHTSNKTISEKAAKGLTDFGISAQSRNFKPENLFLPDSMIYGPEPVFVTIQTEKGEINLELWPDIAPATVSNFVYLANKGFYKNLTFHRVVSDFVIQGGDPRGDGWGGPGYSIPCEYNEKPFIRGSIGMATSGKDTGGSQFFICHSEQPHLNRRYSNFGIVKKGMDVVDNIVKDDKIINIVVY